MGERGELLEAQRLTSVLVDYPRWRTAWTLGSVVGLLKPLAEDGSLSEITANVSELGEVLIFGDAITAPFMPSDDAEPVAAALAYLVLALPNAGQDPQTMLERAAVQIGKALALRED